MPPKAMHKKEYLIIWFWIIENWKAHKSYFIIFLIIKIKDIIINKVPIILSIFLFI